MHEVLKLKEVTKSFSSDLILKSINFSIHEGEIVTLFGPSGCGKSTLLRCIAGLEKVTDGQIIINGTDFTQISPERRPVVMMFQQPLLFPHLNVLQNVTYGLKLMKVKKSRRLQEGKELLRMIGLESHANKYPHELSGGQKQRVALARALAVKPSLLLLDEPFSSLDANLRVSVREWVCKLLRKHKVTAIFVTHDREEAMIVGDRMMIMYDGKIVQEGPPENIYRDPAHPIVAKLFSEGVMTIHHTFIPAHQLELKKSWERVKDGKSKFYKGKVKGSVLKYGQRFYQVCCPDFLQDVFIHSYESFSIDERVWVVDTREMKKKDVSIVMHIEGS